MSAEVMASLVGRRIERAEWDEGEHSRALIWLDDGRHIEFDGYGREEWGAAVMDWGPPQGGDDPVLSGDP